MMLMLLQLAKRRPCPTSLLRLFSGAQHNRRCCSSPSLTTPNPSFMVDYLITSCGVSPDKAARISKRVAHLKSPERPDAVLRFLNQHGFSKADIARLVTWQPDILRSSVEHTLEPDLCALRGMGLSNPVIIKILLSSPAAFQFRPTTLMPRIKFWMDFFGSNETDLVKAFKRGLANHDITRAVAPTMSVLETHGLSTEDIRNVILIDPFFITRNVSMIEEVVMRTKKLGFQPGTGMFAPALKSLRRVSREALQKKMELLQSFGWSEDEFLCALRKQPGIAALSKENLRGKMNFLLEEAKCDISYITSHPQLLQHSLTKRLSPRVQVVRLLESKGLSISTKGLYTLIQLANTEFVDRYILPYKDEIPELCDICEKLK